MGSIPIALKKPGTFTLMRRALLTGSTSRVGKMANRKNTAGRRKRLARGETGKRNLIERAGGTTHTSQGLLDVYLARATRFDKNFR
jgi:hypothetical protein